MKYLATLAASAVTVIDSCTEDGAICRFMTACWPTSSSTERAIALGIPIATGTDAGNPLTLHGPAIYAEMEAMQSAGMN